MAKKKDKRKSQKRKLERRLCRQERRIDKLKKQVKRQSKALAERDRALGELRRQLEENNSGARKPARAVLQSSARGRNLALQHRNAWQRHTYLRERFEEHLGSGCKRQQAREQANRDLMARYGDDAGYTSEQLESILT